MSGFYRRLIDNHPLANIAFLMVLLGGLGWGGAAEGEGMEGDAECKREHQRGPADAAPATSAVRRRPRFALRPSSGATKHLLGQPWFT